MKKWIALLLGVAMASGAFAQGARSPDELAGLVRTAIETRNMALLKRIVHPSADQAALTHYQGRLEPFYGAADLAVFAVPKDNAEAVRKFAAATPVLALAKPLDERVAQMAANHIAFPLVPQGELVVSSKRLDALAAGSQSVVMYGKDGLAYFVVFGVAN